MIKLRPLSRSALLSCIVVLLLGLSIASTNAEYAPIPPSTAHMPQPQPTTTSGSFTGIDMMFVVDQSGSTCGPACGWPYIVPTDPNGWRFQTVQYAMKWLGDFSLFALKNAVVRMSVIGFGDPERSVLLDWTSLAPDQSTEQAWYTQRADLDEILSADYFGARDFGTTNFEDALQLARDRFNRLPAPGLNEHNLKVIIIITDGAPCMWDDPDSCQNVAANREQLGHVYTLTQQAFPPPDFRLYLVVVGAQDINNWDVYRADWETIINDPTRI